MKKVHPLTQFSQLFLVKELSPKSIYGIIFNVAIVLIGAYVMWQYGTSKFEILVWMIIAIELMYPIKVKMMLFFILLLAALFGAALIIGASVVSDRVGTLLFLSVILELYSLVITAIRNTNFAPL